ncbi:MAG: SPOR domain-containing protein [Calditrichae bacterium]|nr:SPOR domain-containing protein [Calditrichota bacterium]MCB9059187.1 SPOR domain-containing protein [Calditrichia bacterium]
MNMIRLFFLFLFMFSGFLYSQGSETLFKMYQQREYQQVKEKYNQIKGNLTKSEQLFFESLLMPDAESAFTNYKELFDKSDGRIKYFAAERLKDYYYAKGYYSTASDYERYLVENRSLIETPEVTFQLDETPEVQEDAEKLYIQVGAFGLEDNAQQMQQMLQTQKVESSIVKKEVNSRLLYCVWVHGKENFQQTLNLANDLKQKYHLDFKIIKE